MLKKKPGLSIFSEEQQEENVCLRSHRKRGEIGNYTPSAAHGKKKREIFLLLFPSPAPGLRASGSFCLPPSFSFSLTLSFSLAGPTAKKKHPSRKKRRRRRRKRERRTRRWAFTPHTPGHRRNFRPRGAEFGHRGDGAERGWGRLAALEMLEPVRIFQNLAPEGQKALIGALSFTPQAEKSRKRGRRKQLARQEERREGEREKERGGKKDGGGQCGVGGGRAAHARTHDDTTAAGETLLRSEGKGRERGSHCWKARRVSVKAASSSSSSIRLGGRDSLLRPSPPPSGRRPKWTFHCPPSFFRPRADSDSFSSSSSSSSSASSSSSSSFPVPPTSSLNSRPVCAVCFLSSSARPFTCVCSSMPGCVGAN